MDLGRVDYKNQKVLLRDLVFRFSLCSNIFHRPNTKFQMMARLLILTLFFTIALADQGKPKLKLGGECEKLRLELEGSDSSADKLSKLNAFLDTLGSDIRQKFWDIIAAAKTDAQTNLPSDTAKELATSVINDFEQGNLFISHEKVKAEVLLDQETSHDHYFLSSNRNSIPSMTQISRLS